MSATTHPTTPAALFDAAEVRRALTAIVPPGQVTELRALNATSTGDRWPAEYNGYFDDPSKLVEALCTIKTATGVYITPNAIDPALLARAANRIKRAGKGAATSDGDITARRWLLIDCDASRVAGVSATADEHQAAIQRARQIADDLRFNYGWPEPIIGDSGNGGHLLYRIELPADDGGLVERCLKTLDAKHTDARVKVDTGVFNPARIWKLYGTLACKGDSTSDRPHRMAKLLVVPTALVVVSRERLEELASELPGEPPKPATSSRAGFTTAGGFDLDAFLARHGLDLDGPTAWKGAGRIWTFKTSPLCDHHGDGPWIAQQPDGAICAGCHHQSCNWGWRELRAKYEPKGAGMPDWRPPEYRGATAAEPIKVEAATPFPLDTLPEAVRAYVGGNASAIGCDASYVALPVLGTLARAIGNSRVIRLKHSWTEPAIIWAAIIGKSGTHKTPALMASMRFLDKRQGESIAKHVEALAAYEQEKACYDRDYAAWKRQKNTSEPPPWPPVEPVCERFVTTDCTIEALASMLAGQFDGLLVSRDELAGWLGGIAEYKGGKGSDLGHWLACWSGVPLTVDRKTGAVKMLHVPRAAVSLVGGIQPGILQGAIGREHLQDGLCARLLMAMPEPRQVRWTEAVVDPQAEAAMQSVFERLLSLEPAADSDGRPMPYPIGLGAEAKKLWVEYYNRHRAELSQLDDDLAAGWSKLEAYTARFALINHLCRWAAGQSVGDEVGPDSMADAIRLSDWFGGEAKRVYGLFGERAEDREHRELVEMIQRRGGSITIRELTHTGRRYRGAGQAEVALGALVNAGWGSWLVESTPGRPRTTFALHPVTPVTGNGSQ